MSRGGRGGARGGARKGQPDFAWDDEEPPSVLPANRPAPTFPRLDLPIPRPLDKTESASVNRYLSFRNRTRNGPYFATLDPSNLTDDKGKVDKRAGFDPFNDQQVYSKRFEKKKRTTPELGGREYALQFFPPDLWPLLDPKRQNPLWKILEEQEKEKAKAKKQKRKAVAAQLPDDEPREKGSDTEDDDVVAPGNRARNAVKSRKKDSNTKQTNQKRGLDAEDDYPDDQHEDEDGDGNEEPEDSEFEEDDDEEGDDYNAEQYFDDGDADDMGDDGGGDGGEEGYY